MIKKDSLYAITMGDPAGIGPEVILKALLSKKIRNSGRFVIIGNFKAFVETAHRCRISLPVESNRLSFLNVGKISKLCFGRAKTYYGAIALESINVALRLLDEKKIDGLITAPVNKHTICKTGIHFSGHTEYLAQHSNAAHVVMMLVGGPLKVALVTRHLALKDVPRALTKHNVAHTIALTAEALKMYFGISHPRIAVCGLNPHAGEAGVMGEEEIRTIKPALRKVLNVGKIEGPLPSDTLFHLAFNREFDAIVAMYHDQGLIPLKMIAFHKGVNVTLGLPYVRTSPDHGTAYAIAGKNKAHPGSMIEAITLATTMTNVRKRNRG